MSTPALLIFKPDASHRLAVRTSIWEWLDRRDDVRFTALRWFQPPAELVEQHYDFLQGRPFFGWLVDFMSALPLLVGRVEVEDLERLRHDLGETQIPKARPGSLRERYGVQGGVNCLHLSDAPDTGERELALWSRYVELEGGVSAEGLAAGEGARDHTYQLRSLATQYAAGIHKELARDAMLGLLWEESPHLDGAQRQAFERILLGAFD